MIQFHRGGCEIAESGRGVGWRAERWARRQNARLRHAEPSGSRHLTSHAPIVSEWHVATVSGERVVDVDLFRASVFRYLLMVSTSLSTSFVAVRTLLEDMFLAFRRLACDMPRSVNSGATIELSVCCRRCARQGAEHRSIGGVARRCALYGRTTLSARPRCGHK